MAKLECEFFPGTPAAWHCDKCSTDFGEKCIPAGHSHHWGRQKPGCIRCGAALLYLGSATDAKPFWQMLPHFFLYPLHPNSLLVIALIAGLSMLFGANLLTLFLGLLSAAIVIKYSFAIIEQRGQGALVPPQVAAVISGDEHHLFLRQIAVFIGMGVAVAAANHVGAWLGVLVAGFITLAMPASTMLLAVEKSVRRALDPLALLSLMFAVGWPYLLLWFCTQIISAGPLYLGEWAAGVLPMSAVVPVLVSLSVYFTFVLYAMLGYVLFEYQNELGFKSLTDQDENLDRQDFEKARALGEVAVFMRDGELQRARGVLRRALDLVHDDMELHSHYHKLLMLLDDDEALINHCDYLVGLLKERKVLGKAVVPVLDVQSRVADFTLADTEAALEIAKLMRMQGQHRAAVRLLQNLHVTHPQDPFIPAAYLLVASAQFEYLNDDGAARNLCEMVLTQYPECPQVLQFEQLLAVINATKAPPRTG